MAINIEGAIRGDDPRIPKAGSLNGVTVLGFLNGKVVSIDATLMDLIDITTKHLPYIGEDYYVYVWDKESQVYIKTEIYVKGGKGDVGASNTLSIGTVAGGINASASITGIAPNQTLNLVLPKGDTGSNIELQKTATHVQWRVVGGSWSNLIALSDLKGDTGANIELQKTTTHVQWRVDGGSWANLIPLTELKGLKGDAGENAVMSIGTITTVASNAQSNATVEADGLDGQGRPKFKLNLWLPRGADGEGTGDMLKSEYDSDGNGIVDNAEKVGGFTVGTNVPANAKFTDTITTVNGKTGAISKADIVALGIPEQDSIYTHPATHLPSIIAQDTNNRFVSDAEKLAWNDKGSSNLALGETSGTAYRGDRGKIAYDHSQAAHAPSNAQKNSDITKAEIEAKLTGAITSHTHSAYVPTSRTVAGKALTGNITLAKGDVGLGNVNNTSDADKPVSTAQQTAISTAINAIEIGGRNLFNKSKLVVGYPQGASVIPSIPINNDYGFQITGTAGSTNTRIRIPDVISETGWWTVSCEVQGNFGNLPFSVNIAGMPKKSFTTGLATEWKRIEITSNVTGAENYVEFADIEYMVFKVRRLKIEKGNKATDWTEAPEDQAAAIALKIDASKFQVVAELPASPATGVFYFIKE